MEADLAPLNPPKYWKYVESDSLWPAVQRYLTAEPLMAGDIEEIARYLRNWICSPSWDRLRRRSGYNRRYHSKILEELRLASRRIHTRRDIEEWHRTAASLGIDPF
jgi:hypothetical protein